MGDVVEMGTERERLSALKQARALRRAQQVALAALNEHALQVAKDNGADVHPRVDAIKERAQWPGGIDDMEF